MPRIIDNPYLTQCPNFADALWTATIASIAQAQLKTADEALIGMIDTWTHGNQQLRDDWDAQVLADEVIEQERLDHERAAEEAEDARIQKELDDARKEKDKHKKTINDFDLTASIGESEELRPSVYAMTKLENLEHVELWPFCQEGLEDNSDNLAGLPDDDVYGFAKTDDGSLTVKNVSGTRRSRKCLHDGDLTWRQMTMGLANMIRHMRLLGWPAKHVGALEMFLRGLESHEYRTRRNGEVIIVRYQAKARQEWFDGLKAGRGFNIAHINPERLRAVAEIYNDSLRDGQVSPFPTAAPSRI